LRRRRSAGLGFRALGFGLVPVRPPAPAAAAAAAARERTGARRRASRQMKNEIPLNSTTAPIAIAIALPPDKLLPPEVPVLVATCGAAVVVGALGPEGSAGENGLLVVPPACAAALAGAVNTSPTAGAASSATPTADSSANRRNYFSDASGCSIAFVSGGLR
jgi:hypothetical protein